MAAGKGTRMKSDLPKVLCPILGKPMIDYVLDALENAGIDDMLVVVGYRGDLVRQHLESRKNIRFVEQTEQLGTGHAVMMCQPLLKESQGPILIIAGDSPMTQTESVIALFNEYEKASHQTESLNSNISCILGTSYKENPFGLGRILRNTNNEFCGIVEERDATDEQKKINEVNMSYYIFNIPDMLAALTELKTNNAQKEYYITDIPSILMNQNKKVLALPLLKPIESLGVNTVDDLKVVETEMKKIIEKN